MLIHKQSVSWSEWVSSCMFETLLHQSANRLYHTMRTRARNDRWTKECGMRGGTEIGVAIDDGRLISMNMENFIDWYVVVVGVVVDDENGNKFSNLNVGPFFFLSFFCCYFCFRFWIVKKDYIKSGCVWNETKAQRVRGRECERQRQVTGIFFLVNVMRVLGRR